MTAPKPIQLLYGNQQLQIDESAATLIQTLLEERDVEFTLQRFDVTELLKDDSEGANEKVDDFCLSCDTLPFLSDRKIIRLDHLEKLKQPRENKTVRRNANARLWIPSSLIRPRCPANVCFIHC